MRHSFRAALVATALVLGPAQAADPVAFVADLRGEVSLDGAGRPLFLAELLPGSRLKLAAKASAAVMFVVSGEEYALKGPGEFVVARTEVRALKGAAPASRPAPQRPSTAVLVEASRSATASLRMRGAAAPKPEAPGLQYPVNARVATLQPTLRWSGDGEATHTVVVIDAAGRELFRGEARGTTLRLPVRLEAGQAYTWTCLAGATALGTARFETLPAAAILATDQARSSATSFTDRALLALRLQELGAGQDAREAWAQLAAERPDLPEIASLAR